MTNSEIARIFRRLADLLELRGENPFKIRSYRTAADTIEDTAAPLSELLEKGDVGALRELPGIGEVICVRTRTILLVNRKDCLDVYTESQNAEHAGV